MREISTEKIEIGEHVMIDGVEYVAEEGSCRGCKFGASLCCTYALFCPIDGKLTKVEKQSTEAQDKDIPMTNQQLSEWLAKGNGLYRFRFGSTEGSFWIIEKSEENLAVGDILIRPWGTDEWIKPTVEIYRRDCRK